MINVLDKSTIDKIAAGEVVEKPVSVVKELVENSIDAGADMITVEVKNGGIDYIRVTDNGSGIPAGDVSLAFVSHATSKIRKSSDLDSIGTLGFRGEALSSIAAVSRVKMITQHADDDTGMEIIIEGSEIISERKTGTEKGTTVIVTDLFYNTPVRRKFLKTPASERASIIEFISKTAVSKPGIRFRMIANGNNLFTTGGKGNRQSAIYNIYGKNMAKDLIPIEYGRDGMKISGYISGVGESRPNRKFQIFFVNDRLIEDKYIEKGLERAYAERLFPGRFPIAFLFISLDASSIDVNIHPNKREIRFDEPAVIEDFVCEAVKEGLATSAAAPKATVERKPEIKPAPAPLRPQEQFVKVEPEQIDIKTLSSFREPEIDFSPEVQNEIRKPFDYRELRIVGRVFSTYIIGETEDAFYLIDQHAAHERVFYEQLLSGFEAEEKHMQTLMLPILLDIPSTDDENLRSMLQNISKLGFNIAEFGGNTYKVSEIPAYMSSGEAEAFLKDFVSGGELISGKTLETIAKRACKSAVKSGDRLNEASIDALLNDLMACDNPYSCPHGRPVYIKYSKSQIERMFRR